jgi:ribosome-associated protein
VAATERAIELAVAAARAAADRKAQEIIALDVSEHLVLTDVFLLASGTNERQVRAIVDAIEEALFRAGAKPIRREGEQAARWVLLDFGDIVVHVQHAEDRVYYALERLWRDCPAVDLPPDARASAPSDDASETGGVVDAAWGGSGGDRPRRAHRGDDAPNAAPDGSIHLAAWPVS